MAIEKEDGRRETPRPSSEPSRVVAGTAGGSQAQSIDLRERQTLDQVLLEVFGRSRLPDAIAERLAAMRDRR